MPGEEHDPDTREEDAAGEEDPRPLPYPESLCHRCGAPPRYVRTKTSVFILCPLLERKYPPQPVLACPLFFPREDGEAK